MKTVAVVVENLLQHLALVLIGLKGSDASNEVLEALTSFIEGVIVRNVS